MEKGSAKPDEDGNITVAENKHYNKMVLANGDNTDIFYVYENPNALPIAFMASNDILDVSLEGDNPFICQNAFFSSLCTDTKAEYFKQVDIDRVVPENAKPSTYGTHTKYVPRIEGENSHIEFILTAPTEDMMYLYFPSSYERKINLWLNGDFVDYYFEGGNEVIQPLGRFSEGEELSVIATITEEKNEVFFADEYFYYLDEEAFKRSVEELNRHPLEIESFKENHIKGTVNADEDGILFTTISYEPGWTIKVDGVKTEPVELVDALIGIPVSAGEHTIEMSFFPKGMTIGIIISMGGVLIVVTAVVLTKRNKKEKTLLDRLYEEN